MMPDLILVNGTVWTANGQPAAEAVAVAGGVIVAVGSNDDVRALAGRETRVIDAAGRLVLPGFNDAHVHLIGGGMSLSQLDLRTAADERQFVERIARHVACLPEGRWITGGNWDHESWPSRRRPTRELIDPVTPRHPVFLRRLDGHIAVANSLALKAAGVTGGTADPPGGRIERDGRGEPTGVLIDQAMALVTGVCPAPDAADLYAAARRALRHAAAHGVTSVQTPCGAGDLRTLQEVRRRGELDVRVYAPLETEAMEGLCAAGVEMPFGDPMLRIGGVKIFADGSLGAGSAWLIDPYPGGGDFGQPIHDEPALREIVRRADAAGLQAVIHAIGDRAVRACLDALQHAADAGRRRGARHRIEHAQLVDPADLPRLAALGVVASIQPSHCIDDLRWVDRRLGPRRALMYPFRSLLDAGVAVALGTDWPVEPLDPMLTLYAAVTRRTAGGDPAGGWHPQEKVALADALAAYTLGAAWAEFEDHRKGSIEPGRLADMVILSRNILAAPPQDLLDTRADLTLVGGRVVYDRFGEAPLGCTASP